MMPNSYTKGSKDQAILEIFYVKKSSDLIGQENFWIKTQEPDC